jgi:hypothetical protein
MTAPETVFKPGAGIWAVVFVLVAMAICIGVAVSHGTLGDPRPDGPSPSPVASTDRMPASGSARAPR